MSYSISTKAATKAEAKAAIAAKFDETVLPSQPIHNHDRAAALATADTFVDLLGDDETKDVSVSLSGWVSWAGSIDSPNGFVCASVSASASLVAREAS